MISEKLRQGCVENEEVLAMATARAEAENAYGMRLLEIRQTHKSRSGTGFNYDEGATVRKAYEGIVTEMGEEGKHHVQVAENIRVLVLSPFRKWSDSHRTRVEFSIDFLKSKVKVYDRETQEVEKMQRKYFNKCRLLDDAREMYEESTGGSQQVPQGENPDEESVPLDSPSLKPQETALKPAAQIPIESLTEEDDDPVELADTIYSAQQVKILLHQMVTEIAQKQVKVPIMGTYDHVSVGSDIVAWLQSNVTSGSMVIAEQFGQDLVANGFLRLVGQVGNKFANSSVLNYQWKKLAFVRAGIEKRVEQRDTFSPFVGEYLSGTINNYLNNPHVDETPVQKLTREVKELDAKYRDSVVRMDDARCVLEEGIFEHMEFLERCESDRLNAIKHVFLDFLASLSNVVPSIQASVDKYLLYQETVVPERDMLYLVESYKTGGFAPRVPVYDNYYSPAEGWTFGIDLELRCQGDGKRLPNLVSSILRHLNDEYPVLENDEVRLAVWTEQVPLKKTHELRREINDGKPIKPEVLAKYPAPVVASVLKLYLLELPYAVINSMLYEPIKQVYLECPNDEDLSTRIGYINTIFGQMRVPQIAVLDALTKHLARLMEIAKPGQEYRDKLASELAPCLFRPPKQTAVTLSDRHPQRLIHDLIEHRKAIITELKRKNSGNSTSRVSSMRSVSTASGIQDASEGVKAMNIDDTGAQRAPAQPVSGPSRLDPGALKLRGPRELPQASTGGGGGGGSNSVTPARQGVTLSDGPPMSPEPLESEPFTSSFVVPSSPSGARHGQVLTNLGTPSSGNKDQPATVDDDSDDEPAITHIQPTPSV